MKRIINGFEVDWASECVFAEQQTAPNYGYLFEVSADRKRIVRCAHVSAMSSPAARTGARQRAGLTRTRSALKKVQGKLLRSS